MAEIKFPFRPDEAVLAAFRQEDAAKKVARIMTETIQETLTDLLKTDNAWDVAVKHHPDMLSYHDGTHTIVFNYGTKTFDLKSRE